MTEEQKQIKIAEACGWKIALSSLQSGLDVFKGATLETATVVRPLPDYFHDLDDMHEAEKTLTQFERSLYRDLLQSPFPGEPSAYWHASATERAEAFGIVKGLW